MKRVLGILIVLFAIPLMAGAQIAPGLSDDVLLVMTPEYPSSNVEIAFEVQSYSFDANRSAITWLVDGAVKAQGIGVKRFVTKTGKLGSSLNILARIVTPNGGKLERGKIVRVADVDVLWKAETTVPSWYRGKSLPTPDTSVVATAVPHIFAGGSRVPTSKLVYTWKVDGKTIASASGYGNSSIHIRTSDFFEPSDVEVTVSTFDGATTARGTAHIPVTSSGLIFYEDSADEGVKTDRPITDGYKLRDGELGIVAELFYFDSASRSRLSYEWRMNDAGVEPTGDPTMIFFRAPDGVSGKSKISLRVSNPANILQTTESYFHVQY